MSESAFDRLAKTPDGARSLARASLRSRVLGLLNRALDERGVSQSDLARKLGIRKSAVHRTLHGNGNLRVDTIADMLSALGYELHVTTTDSGEMRCAMHEGRQPHLHSWLPGDSSSVAPVTEARQERATSDLTAGKFNFRAIVPTHVLDESSFSLTVEHVVQLSDTDPRFHLARCGSITVEDMRHDERVFFNIDEVPLEPSPVVEASYSTKGWIRG